MKVAVDISLYPLNENYIEPIKSVVDRLNAHDKVEVWTNAMSTQLLGEYDVVMHALQQEIGQTFEKHPKAVFAIKILPVVRIRLLLKAVSMRLKIIRKMGTAFIDFFMTR